MKQIYSFILFVTLFAGCEYMQGTTGPQTGSGTSFSNEIPLELSPEDLIGFVDNNQLGAVSALGAPLPKGTYTYYFKDCNHERQLFTSNILELYEVLTDSLFLEKGESWETSDHRIICSDKYGWVSYTGSDIFKLPSDQWTTSLGKEYSYSYVLYATLHELWGHAINGFDHEQHNYSGGGINWNTPVLEQYFHDLYKWTPEQVLDWKNRQKQLGLQGSEFDRKSFMLYYYQCYLTLDSIGCDTFNYIPSKIDFQQMFKNHGRANLEK